MPAEHSPQIFIPHALYTFDWPLVPVSGYLPVRAV